MFTSTRKLDVPLPASIAAPATAPLVLTLDQLELVAGGLYVGPPVPLPEPYPFNSPGKYF
jgi:hypothetical protein